MRFGGKWRIIAMPDFEADYPDMVEPAYILFKADGSGEFAFGCCTGHIGATSDIGAMSIDFSWDGSDELTEVCGSGSAELQADGSLHGEICYQGGDEYTFVAQKWTSSTAC